MCNFCTSVVLLVQRGAPSVNQVPDYKKARCTIIFYACMLVIVLFHVERKEKVAAAESVNEIIMYLFLYKKNFFSSSKIEIS